MSVRTTVRSLLLASLALALATGCDSDRRKRAFGDSCGDDSECESGICAESTCLDPDGDRDGDGLRNGVERNLAHTDPAKADSDGDGLPDGVEVGADYSHPLDRDGDGIVDALESRLPSADGDRDCLPDEFDPRNGTPDTDPAVLVTLGCSAVGVCGTGASAVVAGCVDGAITCDYAAVPGWETAETTCDGRDNDCDGDTDEDALSPPGASDCPTLGVCGASAAVPVPACRDGAWACVYDGIAGWEAVETLCDGLDNDCDGDTDEGLVGGACTNENEAGTCEGTWRCAATGGSRVCEGPVPVEETCNGVDDDCDGQTDEGLAGVPCELGSAAGSCPGLTVCAGDGGTRCDAPVAVPEACNGLDDDCDGDTDEDLVCQRTATVKGTVRALSPAIEVRLFPAASAPSGPLPDATVTVAAGETCTGDTAPATGTWTATTGPDGTFRVAAVPGPLCVFFQATGYQAARSDRFVAGEGEEVPVEATLSPTAESTFLATACGRVTTPSMNDALPMPVPGARVSAGESPGNARVEIASTTADDQGFYCLSGLPASAGAPSLSLQAVKDGYYPAAVPMAPVANRTSIADLSLRPIPLEVTTCLDDDFESKVDGGVDTGVLAGLPWFPDEPIAGVGWQWRANAPLRDVAFDTCLTMPAEEGCTPGTTGCPLCGEVQTPGCIPGAGSVPNAFSGSRAWWFGNPGLGAYLPAGESCDANGTPVGGSLVSPWIEVAWVLDLRLTFASAWEVESFDPTTDRLRVEVQTPAMEATGTWSLVANLKDEAWPSSKEPSVGLTAAGVGRAPTWKESNVDLSPWSDSRIRVRFRFDSVDGNYNAFRGWLVDRVRVTGRGCGTGGT